MAPARRPAAAPLGLLLLLAAVFVAVPAIAVHPAAAQHASLDACQGDRRSLIVSGGMPYTPVRVQGAYGFFVVDFGSDGSAISPSTFLGGRRPVPLAGSRDRFEGLDFFGPWGPVRLAVQDHGGIRGIVPQAGLIGTDLLAQHVVTLDYARSLLHRAPGDTFCDDATLRRAGFVPVSTGGYYGDDPARLRCPAAPRTGGCPNIPTIPLRIGRAEAVAQIDSGYDDSRYPFAININRALLRRLKAVGVVLTPLPEADLSLSTCLAGVRERVEAYRLAPGQTVAFPGLTGAPVRTVTGVHLFVKDTPAAARRCGGIGTWSEPAAQLGASFLATQDAVVFDPFRQRVWFRPRP